MSLINEALKKARLEAARKGDRRHGLLAASHVPARRSVWPWIVTAGSLSLAIGVIVGVLVRGGDEQRVATVPSEPVVEAHMPESGDPNTASGGSTEVKTSSRPNPTSQPVAAAEQSESTLSAEPGPPDAVPPLPSEAPPSSEVEVALDEEVTEMAEAGAPLSTPTVPEDRGAPLPPESLDGRSFLRSVPLPTGKELVLNGIAWSDSGPVALLNGRALEQGEYVEGWRLEVIERRQVELSQDDATITIRLK